MGILEILGYILLVIGLLFMAIGIVGLYRFKGFYERILVASKIDTAGFITVIFGLMLIHGLSFFSFRLVFLLGILLLLGPLSTHIVAKSAYVGDKDIKEVKEVRGEETNDQPID